MSARVSILVAALVGGTAGVGAVAAAVTLWHPSLESTAPPAIDPGGDAGVADVPAADWCAPGFAPIEGGGCFAGASTPTSRPLLVYLHGRYARDGAADEVDRQRRLGARATARGFAVLVLRGRLGACTAPELATWYCWPSNAINADAGAAVVGGWSRALGAAQARAGSKTRYLLGFSNGGYFAGLIASRALLDVDALVVAHGGPVDPVQALGKTPPLLLLSADDDVAQDEMIHFDEELGRAWPRDSYARAGGHGLGDEDIEAALTFFVRSRERLPLQPPLALHRPVRHVRDAGGEVQADPAPDAVPAEEPSIESPAPVPSEAEAGAGGEAGTGAGPRVTEPSAAADDEAGTSANQL